MHIGSEEIRNVNTSLINTVRRVHCPQIVAFSMISNSMKKALLHDLYLALADEVAEFRYELRSREL